MAEIPSCYPRAPLVSLGKVNTIPLVPYVLFSSFSAERYHTVNGGKKSELQDRRFLPRLPARRSIFHVKKEMVLNINVTAARYFLLMHLYKLLLIFNLVSASQVASLLREIVQRALTELELTFRRIHNRFNKEKIEFSASKISRVRDHIFYKCTRSIRDHVAQRQNIPRMFLANISVIFSM